MYQVVVYGYMTYKIYYETHEVIYQLGVLVSTVGSVVEWMWGRIPSHQGGGEYSYVDWILVMDSEPVPTLIPSAPPMAFEYTEYAEI